MPTRVITVREGPGTYTLVLQLLAVGCLIIAAGLTGGGPGVQYCRKASLDSCEGTKWEFPIKNWGKAVHTRDGSITVNKMAGQYFSFSAQLFCILLVVGLLVYRHMATYRNLFLERGLMIAMIVIAVICGCLEAWYGAPDAAMSNMKCDGWIAASAFCFLGAVFYIIDLVMNRSL